MPPARVRATIDDARSEISNGTTQAKDRIVSNSVLIGKQKKRIGNVTAGNDTMIGLSGSGRAALLNGTLTAGPAAAGGGTSSALEAEHETPHTDWSTLPISVLHSYRAAHKLQIPSAHTQSHADLLYKSSPIALRAPSQVAARRKLLDLKEYRRKIALQTARVNAGAVTKPGRQISKPKDKSRDRKRLLQQQPHNGKDENTDINNDNSEAIAPSIEPPSPNSHPSHPTSTSDRSTPSSSSQLRLDQAQTDKEMEEKVDIPSTLNLTDPEHTVIGYQHPLVLSAAIRKHSNARQVSEPDTIARLTYVVRQQGSCIRPRTLVYPVHQRPHILATAATTSLAPATRKLPTTSIGNMLSDTASYTLTQVQGQSSAGAAKNNPHSAMNSLSATSHLGGGHVYTEGSSGDGHGWIMGSQGREVRISDSGGLAGGGGGGGGFRLRFAP